MSDMERRAYEERIGSLENVVTELTAQLDSYQQMVCMLVQKLGNPVIISSRDIEAAPSVGNLVVSADKESGSLIVTFAEETPIDSDPRT